MNAARLKKFIDPYWEEQILPTLAEYICIPNKSPAFDPDWERNGHMRDAVALFERWARERLDGFAGSTLEVVQLDGRTPILFMDIPGTSHETAILYGHLDKQPEFSGWLEGLGPWTPVRRGDKLFGRGGADDGYAMFASLCAILALKEQDAPRPRCIVLIEACEESGSGDLPFYVRHFEARIGSPSLVVCLDSGCGDYDRLWLTTSLRGMAAGTLTVRVLTEGVHSGDASGIVPSPFMILRQVLSRLEDPTTGRVLPKAFYAPVPGDRTMQAGRAARILGRQVYERFPFAGGARPAAAGTKDLVLNRTWRPQLSVIGIGGLPAPEDAGNVTAPFASAKISLRLPPHVDAEKSVEILKALLESKPPFGAEITFAADQAGSGWNAPALAPWLAASVERASKAAFGASAAYMGEGGSIPFMGMLGAKFPNAQFVVAGVLGPHANAHGPNEFLHVPTAKKLTAAVAQILADHAAQSPRPGA